MIVLGDLSGKVRCIPEAGVMSLVREVQVIIRESG